MDADLVAVLRCPVCGDALALSGRTASCPRRHSYDLAKQGYLNLLPSASTGIDGDSAAMIGARTVFLGGGHYTPIRDAVIRQSTAYDGLRVAGEELVVEVGSGTGYYLAGVVGATAGRRGIALDVSRYAARRAAKVDPRIGSVVCDAWRELPLLDSSAQLMLNVFAPRNAAEMARVLAPGGRLLVVTPNQEHLAELVGVLGLVKVDEEKERRLQDSLAGRFDQVGSEIVESAMRLDRTAIEQLVLMTPSARHLNHRELAARIAVLPQPAVVTLSVTLSTWRIA
ncbi:putative RNA methyltransferase [Kribbella sp. NPDC023972]|uniref:putative RNA methyltransferase n=1 Tax=Kribbella sp. NPDC023972 TaxID=3154795 RepID=UPI0033D3B268